MNFRLHSFRFAVAMAALICLAATNANGKSDPIFEKGNQEYAAGHFREAIEQYQELVRAGRFSANLFYNLGNAWFRAGDFGRAILNYERAVALEPNHPEAGANLRLARDEARALELRKGRLEGYLARGNATSYAIAASIAFWITIFALAGIVVLRRRSALLLCAVIVSALAFVSTLFALYSFETGSKGRALAIVVEKDVQARLATADNSKSVLALTPGSEIKILSRRGDWLYAALPNDLRGWVPEKSAEKVRL